MIPSDPIPTSSSSASPLLVACLCAAWCNLCGSYRATFEATAARYPLHRFVWVDIEDHADLVGALDVESFPTLLIASRRGGLRFLGVLTPQAETLERMVRAAGENALPASAHGLTEGEVAALLAGIQSLAGKNP